MIYENKDGAVKLKITTNPEARKPCYWFVKNGAVLKPMNKLVPADWGVIVRLDRFTGEVDSVGDSLVMVATDGNCLTLRSIVGTFIARSDDDRWLDLAKNHEVLVFGKLPKNLSDFGFVVNSKQLVKIYGTG